MIEDIDLLEKYNIICEFDSKPAHSIEFLKTKIKPHVDEVTDFYDKEIRKVDSNHTCSAVISSDSTLKKFANHYPQAFLKEWK